jgi:hypothetical protein
MALPGPPPSLRARSTSLFGCRLALLPPRVALLGPPPSLFDPALALWSRPTPLPLPAPSPSGGSASLFVQPPSLRGRPDSGPAA